MKLWQTDKTFQAETFPEADLNPVDSEAVARLIGTEGWKVIERELRRRLRYAGRIFADAPRDELERAQGYYKGFEAALMTPYDIIQAVQDEPTFEEDPEAVFNARQLALADQRGY
jgi:hypothetical protein